MSVLNKYKLYDFTPKDFEGKTYLHVMSCISCEKVSIMVVSEADYMTWQTRMYVQDAFPYLNAGQREMIINGMHPECFDKLFEE